MPPLYHLTSAALWASGGASDRYVPPTYAQDGFIHLSSDAGLLTTIGNTFYRDQPGEWILLVLDDARLAADVKYEPAMPVGDRPSGGLPDAQLFPHLYGPLNRDAVVGVKPVARAADGTFLGVDVS